MDGNGGGFFGSQHLNPSGANANSITGLPQQPRQKGRPRKRKPKDIEAMTANLGEFQAYRAALSAFSSLYYCIQVSSVYSENLLSNIFAAAWNNETMLQQASYARAAQVLNWLFTNFPHFLFYMRILSIFFLWEHFYLRIEISIFLWKNFSLAFHLS